MLITATIIRWLLWDALLVKSQTTQGELDAAAADVRRSGSIRDKIIHLLNIEKQCRSFTTTIVTDDDLRKLLSRSVEQQLPRVQQVVNQIHTYFATVPTDISEDNAQAQLRKLLERIASEQTVLQSVLDVNRQKGTTWSAAIKENALLTDEWSHYLNELDKSNTDADYLLKLNCTKSGSSANVVVVLRSKTTSQAVLLWIRSTHLPLEMCSSYYLSSVCTSNDETSSCKSESIQGLELAGNNCCCKVGSPNCFEYKQTMNISDMCVGLQPVKVNQTLRNIYLIINAICAILSIVMISVIFQQRKTQRGAREWALMEIFLIGAALLYSIVIAEYFSPPQAWTCYLAVWLRELGFAAFYGTVVLTIYRNLQEYQVRKAHHVYVKEQDLLKYLACIITLTITGLLAWTLGSMETSRASTERKPLSGGATVEQVQTNVLISNSSCPMHLWSIAWQIYELVFLLYALTLCYKARNSTNWEERRQFSIVVLLEVVVSLAANILRYVTTASHHPDTLLTILFVQIHMTVSANMLLIIAPKFYSVSLESSRRTLAQASGSSSRAHPSLAKLRDNLVNGTIDFAEIPINEMNPEDIRAELKRVYTQLRMYKLKNIYQDNPHIITKRKGGKKASDKEKIITKNRRISIPPSSPQTKNKELSRVDEDEKSSMISCAAAERQISVGRPTATVRIQEECPSTASNSDYTVESAPHNLYLARGTTGGTYTTTNKLPLEEMETDQSAVRV